MDWFDAGIFGGLFGKGVVQFLRRYRLRLVFISVVIAVELSSFLSMAWHDGLIFAWHRFFETAFTVVGILVPLGIGALCVVALVVCAPELLGKPKTKKTDDHH